MFIYKKLIKKKKKLIFLNIFKISSHKSKLHRKLLRLTD